MRDVGEDVLRGGFFFCVLDQVNLDQLLFLFALSGSENFSRISYRLSDGTSGLIFVPGGGELALVA